MKNIEHTRGVVAQLVDLLAISRVGSNPAAATLRPQERHLTSNTYNRLNNFKIKSKDIHVYGLVPDLLFSVGFLRVLQVFPNNYQVNGL